MDIELTDEEIRATTDYWSGLSDNAVKRVGGVANAATKKAIEWFLSQASFMEWEWEDSKGVWDICLDDNAVKELKQLLEE